MPNDKSMIVVETPTEVVIQPRDWAPFANSFSYRYRYCARSGRGEFQDGFGRLLEVCPLEVDDMIRLCTKAITRHNATGFALIEVDLDDDVEATLNELMGLGDPDFDDDDGDPMGLHEPRPMSWMFQTKKRMIPLCDSQYHSLGILDRIMSPTCFGDDMLPILHMGIDILKQDEEYQVEDGELLTWVKHLPTGMCFEFSTKHDTFIRFTDDPKNTPSRKTLGYET